MKLSKIIKALEDGNDVHVNSHNIYSSQYYKDKKRDCIDQILNDIACNRTFEIIEPNKMVKLRGVVTTLGTPLCFSDVGHDSTYNYEISYEVDKDKKPICDTIKMVEL